MNLPGIILILALTAGGIGAAAVYFIYREQKTIAKINNTSDNPDQQESESKSFSIIERANKKARDILVQAELTGIKEVARSKHDTQELENIFETHLQGLTKQSASHLEKTSTRIEQHYIDLFKKTEAFITKQIADNQQRIINQLDLVSAEAEKTIHTQSAAAQEELVKRMDAELAASKKMIAAYQKKRMDMIDQEIVSIVAKTVQQTLGKTISPQDHADLIKQALERAKKEGFLPS